MDLLLPIDCSSRRIVDLTNSRPNSRPNRDTLLNERTGMVKTALPVSDSHPIALPILSFRRTTEPVLAPLPLIRTRPPPPGIFWKTVRKTRNECDAKPRVMTPLCPPPKYLPAETPPLLGVLSLCLSRACLGKTIVFSIKWGTFP